MNIHKGYRETPVDSYYRAEFDEYELSTLISAVEKYTERIQEEIWSLTPDSDEDLMFFGSLLNKLADFLFQAKFQRDNR